ncbi:hypothetical protein FN846DRAFT_906048 [Sphaerosporella brunnea]|uniref:Uncharacterized protein n=1 Tax=Sphaerosporella brunnea TaxID=1250544 RepID=A0A5J5EZS9_9PEZI|nr:hypothetical protein FN846DRAFT_906048 [Sphaerosporella brunnea]
MRVANRESISSTTRARLLNSRAAKPRVQHCLCHRSRLRKPRRVAVWAVTVKHSLQRSSQLAWLAVESTINENDAAKVHQVANQLALVPSAPRVLAVLQQQLVLHQIAQSVVTLDNIHALLPMRLHNAAGSENAPPSMCRFLPDFLDGWRRSQIARGNACPCRGRAMTRTSAIINGASAVYQVTGIITGASAIPTDEPTASAASAGSAAPTSAPSAVPTSFWADILNAVNPFTGVANATKMPEPAIKAVAGGALGVFSSVVFLGILAIIAFNHHVPMFDRFSDDQVDRLITFRIRTRPSFLRLFRLASQTLYGNRSCGTNPASAQTVVKSPDSASSFEVYNMSEELQTDYLRVMQK